MPGAPKCWLLEFFLNCCIIDSLRDCWGISTRGDSAESIRMNTSSVSLLSPTSLEDFRPLANFCCLSPEPGISLKALIFEFDFAYLLSSDLLSSLL